MTTFLCELSMACLPFVGRAAGLNPGGSFGFNVTGSLSGHAGELERASQIAPQPAHVRNPGVRRRVRPEIHHALISLDSFSQFALFHENIAEQPKVNRQAALGDQGTGQWLGLAKPMQALSDMSSQEHRRGTPGLSAVQTGSALFGKGIETWIEGGSRLFDVKPAELFQRQCGRRPELVEGMTRRD